MKLVIETTSDGQVFTAICREAQLVVRDPVEEMAIEKIARMISRTIIFARENGQDWQHPDVDLMRQAIAQRKADSP